MVYSRSISIKDRLRGKPPGPSPEDSYRDSDKEQQKGESPGSDVIPLETFQKAWNDYAESIRDSHPRIYSTLQKHQPEQTGDSGFRIRLDSEAQRTNFNQRIKPELIRYLKEHVRNIEYQIESYVQLKKEEGNNKLYTDQDKLDYLAEKNPLLKKFKNSFKLDFDD